MKRNIRNGYGKTSLGEAIEIPEGWGIINEGEDIPHEHRECIEDYMTGKVYWCDPRRCHSTMTPLKAMVWGGVRVIAKRKVI